MAGSRAMGLEILRHSCASRRGPADRGARVGLVQRRRPRGSTLSARRHPLGARMIAIVEAFDAMTTDQRATGPAMSLESAMMELFRCAGTQFDPDLVRDFAEFHLGDQRNLHREVASAGCRRSIPRLVNSYWQLNCVAARRRPRGGDVAVPGQAAGQHVRRGGVHRRRDAGPRLEPRRRAAHGHPRHQHAAAAVAARPAEHVRRKRRAGPGQRLSRPLRDPVGRAVAAAVDDLRAGRPAASPSTPTRSP